MARLTPAVFSVRAMQQALTVPVPTGDWPTDRKVRNAEQCAEVGKVLCHHTHKHLVNVSIGYLFVETMADALAKASKTSGPLQFYSEHHFLIRVNWTEYLRLDLEQRVALIDHELCHFGVEDTATGTKYVLIPHDVEEFGAIVQRWGLWRPNLKRLSSIMLQRDLFEKDQSTATEP